MTHWTARTLAVNSILSVGTLKKLIQSRLQEGQNQRRQTRLNQDFITLRPPTTVRRYTYSRYACIVLAFVLEKFIVVWIIDAELRIPLVSDLTCDCE
jgi:hypothetical protein